MLNVRPWTPAPPSISIQVRSNLSTILSSPGSGPPVVRKRSEKYILEELLLVCTAQKQQPGKPIFY